MSHIVGIVAGKGGVGKTTTAINLGLALTNFGRDVVVVDGNLFSPNIGLYLGIPLMPITLHEVAHGRNHITEAAYLHPSGLKVIPASLSFDSFQKINYENLKKSLSELKNYGEIILIDTHTGLGRESTTVLESVDKVLVVVNPDLPSVTDAIRAIKIAEKLGKEVIGVIINKVRNKEYELKPENIKTLMEKPVYGMISYDEDVISSLHQKQPVLVSHPTSRVSDEFYTLAGNLIGRKHEQKQEAKKERLGIHDFFDL